MTAPAHPRELRKRIVRGEWTTPTAGILDDYQQANLVVIPDSAAADFRKYCAANPDVCPLLATTDPGDPLLTYDACTVDLRTALPRYRVWRNGALVAEPADILDHWRDDAVAFALGCSHTFDAPLRRIGVPVPRSAPPVYVTDRPTTPAGIFGGPLAVSMRPVPESLIAAAVELTARYPTGHGAPVQIGSAAELGIADLSTPDFGVYAGVPDGCVPVFWACGVTPQMALPDLGLDYAITHFAGHMLVLDTLLDETRTIS
ncbi:D-glutamate cyclase family protein [Nocardia carnea]|uniref:D-glutamate cyclase family protein n=1 Tax=Nocardia carnea TaxID=37328 RepID=UPI0024563BDD|nr:DUF1445 domain-containing protein [Nocardia carnea]